MDKGCIHTYKGVTYENYQDLKEVLIEEQSTFYFAPFMEAVINKLGEDGTLTSEERQSIVKELSEEYMLTEDISVTLSELLSAATDNAKELILSKINAGPETAGIYAYLTMLGVPFLEISEMMTSPAVKWIIERSRKNVFDTKTDFNSLKGATKELLEGPNIYKYMDIDRIHILDAVIRENLVDSNFINALAEDSQFRDPATIKALLNTKKKTGPVFNLGSSVGITTIEWKDPKLGPTKIDLGISKKDIKDLYSKLLKGSAPNKTGTLISFIPAKHAIVSTGYSDMDYDNDYAYEDGESYGDGKMPVKIEISRYLEEVLEHLDTDFSIKGVEEFATILEDAKETITLGSMLSSNQGIKTDAYSQYAFTRRISDFVIEKSRKFSAERVGEDPDKVLLPQEFKAREEKTVEFLDAQLTAKGISTKYSVEVVTNFDFLKFLGVGLSEQQAEVYRETSKLYYNNIKSAFNILSIVDGTPHFKAMLSVAGLMENMKAELSVKFNLVNKLIKNVYDENIIKSEGYYKTLSEKDFYKIMDFANDTIILKWISSLDNNKTFTYSTNSHYETDRETKALIKVKEKGDPTPHTINVSSAEGRLAFIDMIHEMMLILKEGKTLVNGEIVDHPLLKNKKTGTKNEFIHGFDIDKKKDPITGKNYRFYKLPMNVLNINDSNTHKFNQYLIGFSDLARVTYNGVPVKDLLFLYNTFIHRDKINRESLTKLYESGVDGIEGTLMGEFIEWGGKLDWDNQAILSLKESKNYGYDITDIIIKGLATKIFSKNLTKYNGMYAYSMVFNPTTGSVDKQYYSWAQTTPDVLEVGKYEPYTHFSKDMAIALSAGSEVGVQRASNNNYKNLVADLAKRDIYLNNIQINCE
jgi:hypothetical protein